MNTMVFWSILIALQLICLWAAYRSTQASQSTGAYFLGNKSLAFFPLLMSFIGTQIGGGLILGSAEEAYRMGWSIIFYPLGMITGFLLLATGLGGRLANLGVSTVAQVFETSYDSKRLRSLASCLSILTLFLIVVAQVVASRKFLATFGMDNPWSFLIIWGAVLVYTMRGGIIGIASIDAIQASFFLVVFGVAFAWLVMSNPELNLEAVLTHSFAVNNEQAPIIAWFMMPCLFMLCEQDMAQRCFSARTSHVVRSAAMVSAVLTSLICLVPIYLGLSGKMLGISITEGSSVLMSVVQRLGNPILTAFVACAVMMAVVSTAVSLINSVSSNIIQDFKPAWNKKIATIMVGVSAIFCSFAFENALGLLIQSYEIYIVCLFVPIFMRLIGVRGSYLSAAMAIGFGAFGFLIFRFDPIHQMVFLPRELLELTLSTMGFMCGKMIESRQNPSRRAGSAMPILRGTVS